MYKYIYIYVYGIIWHHMASYGIIWHYMALYSTCMWRVSHFLGAAPPSTWTSRCEHLGLPDVSNRIGVS